MKLMTQRVLRILAVLALLGSFETFADGLEGKWVLVKRMLPDGKVLTPPAVLGQFSIQNGLNQLVVFWPMPNGNSASLSSINKWDWTRTLVTVTPILSIFDDGSGKPPVYTVGGSQKSSPISRNGNIVSYQHPTDPPFNVWDGDKLTATFEGVFVDYWERVR
jgi:hypothetical protein